VSEFDEQFNGWETTYDELRNDGYIEFAIWLEKFIGLTGEKLTDYVKLIKRDDSRAAYLYTESNEYFISASLPSDSVSGKGYLGCIATSRKTYAGEKHRRGSDLPDGKYTKETFDVIVNAILRYELVRVHKRKPTQIN
jgi:hypothetical protein